MGEAGGHLQGGTAPAREAAVPVSDDVAVQRQRRWRVERVLGHHSPQGLVDTDTGCQSADEGDLRGQGGGKPHWRTSHRMGKRETSRGLSLICSFYSRTCEIFLL